MIDYLRGSLQKLKKGPIGAGARALIKIKRNPYCIQSFTYYIPAPPPRKTGYREKEFDKIFYSFINAGYEIISIHTEAHIGPQSSGLWVIVIVRATSEKTNPLKWDFQYENGGNGPEGPTPGSQGEEGGPTLETTFFKEDGPELNFASANNENILDP